MTGLSEIVIYLVVALIEVLNPTEPVTVDYLQDLAPAAVIRVAPLEDSDNDVYLVTHEMVRSNDDGEVMSEESAAEIAHIRIEQSDLYAHNYFAYSSERPPLVMDLSVVRRQLARVNSRHTAGEPFQLSLDMSSPASASAGTSPGGAVHLMFRGAVTLLAAEAEGILLVAE